MGYHFITASKDASVYLQQPNQNTGLDEIIEVSKIYYGTIKDISRGLLQFDLSYLSQSIQNGNVSLEEVELVLREADTEEIPLDYTIYGYSVYSSWEMGSGTRFDKISTQGATWNYREGDSQLDWLDTILIPGLDANPNNGAGGAWYTSVSSSQSYSYQSADVKMDVKDIVDSWLSGSITNNGLILKHSNAFENDENDYGILKFFSKETHTIYQPKLMVSWDSQVFTTGSLSALDVEQEIIIKVKNLKKEYRKGSKAKIRVSGRELYPVKTFSSSFSYGTTKYLPSNTEYQVRDYESNDVIIPFGTNSRLNCDTSGNYIEFDFTNWESNREYSLEFRVVNSGVEKYFEDDITFNIID
jgi:hypothetical protein